MAAVPPYLSVGVALKVAGGLLLLTIVRFFYRVFQARVAFRRDVKKYDLPTIPNHSMLLGHLAVMGKLKMSSPPDTSGLALPLLMLQEYPELVKHGIVYLDLWPVMWPMTWVFDPDMCAQFTQETSLPKAPNMRREFQPLTQCKDLVLSEGQEWKTWRSIFNPGFSAKNLTAMVPNFLEEIEVFRQKLVTLAKTGEVMELEKLTQQLTADVICRAVIGHRAESQTKDNHPFLEALKNQISWLIPGHDLADVVFKSFNPIRPLIMWNNNRIMRNFLTPHIENSARDHVGTQEYKTVTNLAIKAYAKEVKGATSSEDLPAGQKLDPAFVDRAIAHLKMFLFAGHDTTASTMCFIYWYLSTTPRALAAVRAEHDAVLGTDPTTAQAALSNNPHLLNQLPYTSAVIKETLRFCPPAATVRQGHAGFEIVGSQGRRFPTEGRMLVSMSFATQQHGEYWDRPREFLPERWLAREGEPLYPRKNAWRPFELGPRNCIGQELASMEMRAILALTVREFDFEAVYGKDAPELWGQRAYQVMRHGEITGHAAGGYPVRIRVRGER